MVDVIIPNKSTNAPKKDGKLRKNNRNADVWPIWLLLFGYFYLATSISTAYVSRYIPQLIVHLSMDCVSLNDVIIRITSIVIIFFTKYVGIVIHIDKP